MKPLFTKKNGTSQRVAAVEVKMPATYPASRVTHESVSFTVPNDSMTLQQALNGLMALADYSKMKWDSYFLWHDNGSENRYIANRLSAERFIFFAPNFLATSVNFEVIDMYKNYTTHTFKNYKIESGVTVTDLSSTTGLYSQGVTISIVY